MSDDELPGDILDPMDTDKSGVPMTCEEKVLLRDRIGLLPGLHLSAVVEIVRSLSAHATDENDDEIQIDIDALDTITLRRLEEFVNSVLPSHDSAASDSPDTGPLTPNSHTSNGMHASSSSHKNFVTPTNTKSSRTSQHDTSMQDDSAHSDASGTPTPGKDTPKKRSKSIGDFLCEQCGMRFTSKGGLTFHARKNCDGGLWRCEWCQVDKINGGGRCPGPNGPSTLCSTCGSRFRAGHSTAPEKADDGKFVCEACGAKFGTIRGLGGHRRFCSGGTWRCEWCNCDEASASGKSPGPNGKATLCSVCSSRFRSGHTGPPSKDENGRFICPRCNNSFETIRGLGSHRRGCTGGLWKCDWCSIDEASCGGRCPGPSGPRTLCSACGSRFRAGHTGPPTRTEDGHFLCEDCGRKFESIIALGGHRRFCDGGKWRCEWCDCGADEASGKSPGPNGPKTLCSACGSRFRAGHSGPPPKDEDGMYVCQLCGGRFATIPGLGSHRRFCESLQPVSLLEDDHVAEGGSSTVTIPATQIFGLPAHKVPDLLEAWDFAHFAMQKVFPEIMTKFEIPRPPVWSEFQDMLVRPKVHSGLALLSCTHAVLLAAILPRAAPPAPDLMSLLNNCTWLAMTQRFFASHLSDVRCPLASQLYIALAEHEYDDLPLDVRCDILIELVGFALRGTQVEASLDQAVAELEKLRSQKRSEYTSRLQEIKNKFRVKDEDNDDDDDNKSDVGDDSGDDSNHDDKEKTGDTEEQTKRKYRARGTGVTLRAAEAEARDDLDEKFWKLQTLTAMPRAVCLGSDRDNRKFWALGGRLLPLFIADTVSPSSTASSSTSPSSPTSHPPAHVSPSPEVWKCVETPEQLEALVNSLRPKGKRESVLLSSISRFKKLSSDENRDPFAAVKTVDWPSTNATKSNAAAYLETFEVIQDPNSRYRCEYCAELLDPARELHCNKCHTTFKIKDSNAYQYHVGSCPGTAVGDIHPGLARAKAELQDIEGSIEPLADWADRRKASWIMDVKQAPNAATLHSLLVELCCFVNPLYIAKWWRPWGALRERLLVRCAEIKHQDDSPFDPNKVATDPETGAPITVNITDISNLSNYNTKLKKQPDSSVTAPGEKEPAFVVEGLDDVDDNSNTNNNSANNNTTNTAHPTTALEEDGVPRTSALLLMHLFALDAALDYTGERIDQQANLASGQSKKRRRGGPEKVTKEVEVRSSGRAKRKATNLGSVIQLVK
eukprot:c7524_g1_i1.p1 GENE.c7524_g1_i1~~c7524_g1_i1.p1  ORF type:complete len:1227 (-),score=282.36 c7524_g1_i1:81-3761(-)